MQVRTLISCALLGHLAVSACAGTYASEAEQTIYVNQSSAGVRQGPFGILYFDIRGESSGNLGSGAVSYGVCEFNTNRFLFPDDLADFTGFRVRLTQHLQSYSSDGPVDVWLTKDNASSLNQDDDLPVIGLLKSTLIYKSGVTPPGLGDQLESKVKLGTINFTKTNGDGVEKTLNVTLSPDDKDYVLFQILTRQPIRLAFTPANNSVNATFAGYVKIDKHGPTLEVTSGAATGRISGTVDLGDWIPDQSGKRVIVTIETPGGEVVRTLETRYQSSAGKFLVQNVDAGTYRVFVKSDLWLRKFVGEYTLGAADVNIGTHTLLGADANNDNTIGTDDYLVLNSAFDTTIGDPTYTPAADFNGDNAVSTDDYLILNKNFDITGD